MLNNYNDVKLDPDIKMGSGVMPDYNIQTSVEDVINDRDPQMEFAIGLIKMWRN